MEIELRIAFLILAHHQPSLLRRLIKRLQSEYCFFFIHVDMKSNIQDFKLVTSDLSRVVYLPDSQRVKVNWGGYTVVSATLNLVISAISSEIEFSRFCLLSGNDYPLKPIEFIRKEFESSDQFIQIQRRLNSTGTTSFDQRARRFFLGDSRWTNPRTVPTLLNRIIRKIESFIPRKFPENFELYYGSQWWSLTGTAMKEILTVIKQRPDIIDWLRWTNCPDELFFQTFLKLTAFSDEVVYDYHRTTAIPDASFEAMHYVDWFSPTAAPPKILDLCDLPKIRTSKALFARKFDEDKSKSLMEALDEELYL